MDPDEVERWIADARRDGPQVLSCGLWVFLTLGFPFWMAAVLVGILMFVVLLIGAGVTFPASGPESPDR